MGKTFGQARAEHLARLDEDYARLREIVSSPDWCNPIFRPYTEARERLQQSINRIRRLNSAASDALDS